MTVRVLIADDHPIVRSGIRGMLAAEPGSAVVAEASTGTEAVTLALREQPDVVLMDLQMPELDGAAATAQIRQQRPHTQVLVLTTYDTDADIVRAIDAGAVETTLAPTVANRLLNRARGRGDDALSGREIDVLRLAAGGLSNSQIAGELFVSATTVKAHLAHISTKLGVADRTGAVTTALERGIIRLG